MELIRELRDRTGAGIVDCKKALEESGNDLGKAVEILRKKGIAKAAKRGEKETKEGLILLTTNADGNEGYMLEINSETDFVARNEKFQQFATQTLDIIKNQKPENVNALLAINIDNISVRDNLENLSGVIGEKLALKKSAILSAATVAAYSHMGGRIGVLVALDQPNQQELAKEMAMQIAATNPKYINSTEVTSEELDKEKEIYREQLIKEGKPENMIDKIMSGKIAKYYEEICLMDQEFIKDDKKKVKDILIGVKIEKFIRYSL
jgi:elongation factor Ts